ncbi:hypothetical protein RBB50_002453 [Rhinocladiella similis]
MARQRDPACDGGQDGMTADTAEKASCGITEEGGGFEEVSVGNDVCPVLRPAEDGRAEGVDCGVHQRLDGQGVGYMHEVEQPFFLRDSHLGVKGAESDAQGFSLQKVDGMLHCFLLRERNAHGAYHVCSAVAETFDVGVLQGAREEQEQLHWDFQAMVIAVDVLTDDAKARMV